MSKLIKTIERSKNRLNLGSGASIPQSEWKNIAKECGEDEKNEIIQRIKALDEELKTIPAWDDTQDNIFFAKEFFRGVLKLIK